MQIFRGSMPPDPPKDVFSIFRRLKLNLSKKLRLKSDENWCLLPKQNSEYAPDMKTFSKGLFTPVSGSKRLCISLTFNLIQNYIYPTKTFWIRSCIQRMAKCYVILKTPPLQNPGYASGLAIGR